MEIENSVIPLSLVGPHVIECLIDTASKSSSGCFVEVGVYKGGTAWHLAKLAKEQGRDIFLFDTFTGIPYKGQYDPVTVGTFNETSLEEVQKAIPYAKIIQGIFPQSAKNLDLPKIAFAHLDCDQYQSIKESVEFLRPLMANDGVMWFDDYNCGLEGADKAVNESFPSQLKMNSSGKFFVRF